MDSQAKAMVSQAKAMETTKKYLTTAASIAASAMLARTIVNEYLPYELRNFVSSGIDKLFSRFSTDHTIVIQENEGLTSNELYDASSTYLRTRISSTMRRLRASKNEENNSITLSLDDGEELIDAFQGVQYKWQLINQQENQGGGGDRGRDSGFSTEVRWYELTFHKKYKDFTLDSYLPHILEKAKEIKSADRRLKLYMNEYESWSPIDLQHPATFETLALEADLLFGPPGTGKSTLIAAMANYLRFDIYDLDLKEVRMNSGLKRLLVGMTNKSLLVIEDIDCSIDLKNRDEEKKENESSRSSDDEVTLSGLLNFIDGLWSTSGEERIIVFTTNYKERLDPALLRPGRMDMHVHMGYCGPNSFRVLASNYHAVEEHPMFEEIEGLLKEVEATPAEVAEQLMRSDDVDIALEGLAQLLRTKKNEGQRDQASGEEDKDEKVVAAEKGGVESRVEDQGTEKVDVGDSNC